MIDDSFDLADLGFPGEGTLQSALDRCTREITANPGDAEVHLLMASIHSGMGKATQACVWLKQTISMDEWFREVALGDPAFDPMREQKCFRDLVE